MHGFIAKGGKANKAIIEDRLYCNTCKKYLNGEGLLVIIEHEDHELIKGPTDIIDIVRIKHPDQDLIFSLKEWIEMGKYKGFIKSVCMPLKDVLGVEYTTMGKTEFDNLSDWMS